jgi:hypothetical protein
LRFALDGHAVDARHDVAGGEIYAAPEFLGPQRDDAKAFEFTAFQARLHVDPLKKPA